MSRYPRSFIYLLGALALAVCGGGGGPPSPPPPPPARAEFTAHNFAAARKHATQLTQLDPGKGYPYELLGDALLELGEYEQAEQAFAQSERLSGAQSLGAQLRRGRVSLLLGQLDEAR